MLYHCWKSYIIMLKEQYVMQELVSDTAYTPYYFGTDSQNFEMDFMIQKGRDAVPIEVKAEENTQAKSMKAYCRKYTPNYAVRFSILDYIEHDFLTNIPLYAVCNI